jgi:hypothetical protein
VLDGSDWFAKEKTKITERNDFEEESRKFVAACREEIATQTHTTASLASVQLPGPAADGTYQNIVSSKPITTTRKEVEGPKQPPRYESLGEPEMLPANIPDGTILSDSNIGQFYGKHSGVKMELPEEMQKEMLELERQMKMEKEGGK